MASVRLAVYMVDSILHSLLDRAFKERREALEARRLALGDAVYKRTYSAEELKVLKKVPKDFLLMDGDRSVKFAGDHCRVRWGEHRPISADRNNVLVLTAHDPLTDEYRRIEAEKEKLASDERTARLEAKAKLKSVSTVQRLIEVWPEVRPFAEVYLRRAKKAQLPVPQNDVLNQVFKLPVEPAKKAATKKASRK